jgi:ribosomal protein L11 methyltransferase
LNSPDRPHAAKVVAGVWCIEFTVPEAAVPEFEAAIEAQSLALSVFPVGPAAHGRCLLSAIMAERPNPADLRALLGVAAVRAGIGSPQADIAWLRAAGWVEHSLDLLPPIRVGRFRIRGSHHPPIGGPSSLCIDAGAAFGTGGHESTRGCLMAIERLAHSRAYRRPLDIGTGTGVLAMAMARLFRAHVIAGDNDPLAVDVARRNVARNELTGWIRIREVDGFGASAVSRGGPYDLIVMNLLLGPIIVMAPAVNRHLTGDGRVILSGLLRRQARTVIARYVALGLRLESRITAGEWETLVLRSGGRAKRHLVANGEGARRRMPVGRGERGTAGQSNI